MRQTRVGRRTSVVFAVLLAAGACGDADNGPDSVAPSPSTSEAGSPASTDGVGAEGSGPEPGASTTPEFPTIASAPPPVDLLVGTAQGLLRLGTDGTEVQLVDGPVAWAVADTRGGVVFQTARGRYAGAAATIVWRLAAGAAEPVELIRSRDDQRLSLHEGSNPTDSVDTLRRFDMASGAITVLGEVGGWEAGSDPVSVGGGIIARQWYVEVNSGFAFQDLSGDAIEVPGDPYGPSGAWGDHCSDDLRCPRLVEIASDGARYAYLEAVSGPAGLLDHYRLLVLDAATGRPLGEAEIALDGQEGGTPDSLDLDGRFVVVNRSTQADSGRVPLPALVVDLDTGDVVTIEHAGVARLV